MDASLFNKELLEQYLLAGSENTKAEQLRVLADHFCDKIRMRVAENHATPKDILRNLSRDSNHDVRIAVATNPNTESDVLERLARDEDVTVRHGMAQEICVPRMLLEQLSDDENVWVRNEAQKTIRILNGRGGDEIANRRKMHLIRKTKDLFKEHAGLSDPKAAM